MRRINKSTSPASDVGILLGQQGEDGVLEVVFDLTWLIEKYGEGIGVFVHQRSKDGAPYLCITSQDGNTLTWVPGSLDTAFNGWGEAELRWTVNGGLAKTITYKTLVIRSVTGEQEMPDAYQSWYDKMIEYIEDNCISPEELGDAIDEYMQEHPVPAPVESVNGKTGDVVLTASDVGALPDSTAIPVIDSTLSTTGQAADAKATGDALGLKADLASPAFSGTPTAPNSSISANNTTIANTAFVHSVVNDELKRIKNVWTGTCATSATTATKVISLDRSVDFDITTDPIIVIYFSKGNAAFTPLLKIGTTGEAYPVYYQTSGNGNLVQMDAGNLFSIWGRGVHIFKFSTDKWIATHPDMYHIYQLATEMSDKANKASPALTGTPTAPTAATGTNTTQIATTAFVQQEIAAQSISATVTDGNLTLSLGVVNNG